MALMAMRRGFAQQQSKNLLPQVSKCHCAAPIPASNLTANVSSHTQSELKNGVETILVTTNCLKIRVLSRDPVGTSSPRAAVVWGLWAQGPHTTRHVWGGCSNSPHGTRCMWGLFPNSPHRMGRCGDFLPTGPPGPFQRNGLIQCPAHSSVSEIVVQMPLANLTLTAWAA